MNTPEFVMKCATETILCLRIELEDHNASVLNTCHLQVYMDH